MLSKTELRKLIRAHNILSKIVIPKGASLDDMIKLVEKAGYNVNHEKKKLEQKVKRGKQITLKQAEEITKPKPKTALQKQKVQEKKEEKQMEQKKKEREIRKKAVAEEKKRQKDIKGKSQSINKVEKKQMPKTATIGTQTDSPAPAPKKESGKKPFVIIKYRKQGKTYSISEVKPTNEAIQKSIQKEFPGYGMYEKVMLIKMQKDKLEEKPFKKAPTFDVLLKANDDLQVQAGVEGSTSYGKRVVLKKAGVVSANRPIFIAMTVDGRYPKPDGKLTKSRDALKKAYDKIDVNVRFVSGFPQRDELLKQMKEKGIEEYRL